MKTLILLLVGLTSLCFAQPLPGPSGGGGTSSPATLFAGTAAKCASGVAGPGIGVPSSSVQPSNAAPPATFCEADGFHGYMSFYDNGAEIIADQFELPTGWSTLSLVLSAWSASTGAPTITAKLLCLGSGSSYITTGGTYGSAQSISLTPSASSGRTVVTTALLTDAGHATKACAVGDLLQFQISVTPATQATTFSISSGSPTMTVASGTGIVNGDYVYGTGINVGTTVSSGGGTTTLTLSQNANATEPGGTAVTFVHPLNLIAARFTP